MDNAIWSDRFARDIAQSLEYLPPGSVPQGSDESCHQEAERIIGAIKEEFRYLPLDKIQVARNFALFLRTQRPSGDSGQNSWEWLLAKLREILDLVLFLRARHGHAHPADESEEWTDEDRRDATQAAMQRLDQEDPYPLAVT